MPVVGVLVEAEVGDQHEVVADLVRGGRAARPARCRRVPRARALGVLRRRARRTGSRRHAEGGELGDFLAQRLARVLHDAGQRRDRLRLVDALAHEQRRDEVVDGQTGLGDQPAQRRRAPQPPQPPLRKATAKAKGAARRGRSARTRADRRSAAERSMCLVMRFGTAMQNSPAASPPRRRWPSPRTPQLGGATSSRSRARRYTSGSGLAGHVSFALVIAVNRSSRPSRSR